jgi:hypothetical protein
MSPQSRGDSFASILAKAAHQFLERGQHDHSQPREENV